MESGNRDIITVDTVEEYAALFGCPPVCHPLLSVCRLSDVKDYSPVGKPVQLNLYTITIKDRTTCNASYGWRSYDFSSGAFPWSSWSLCWADGWPMSRRTCPYGIDIPANFLHYNKCVNHGNVPKSSMDSNYEKARRAFLVGYDRSVPRLRQASHCIGCGQCTPKCPQGINIPEQMRMIDEYAERLRQD